MSTKSELKLRGEKALSKEAVDRLKKVILLARQRTGLLKGLVNVSFVSDAEISELNARFLKRRGTTDVMSFPIAEIDPDTGQLLLGDIAVSIDTAKRVADEKGHSWEAEAVLYALHGFLHLGDFNDDIPSRRKKMWNAQMELMQAVGWAID